MRPSIIWVLVQNAPSDAEVPLNDVAFERSVSAAAWTRGFPS